MSPALEHSEMAELAAASRILAAKGVVDGFGHVSMRHPRHPDRFLLSRSLAPALVTPEDILEYGLDGEAIDPGAPKGFLERFIHSSIYAAREDVCGIVHSHSPSVIPFGLLDIPFDAMFHNAAFLGTGVPRFDIGSGFGATDMLVCDCAKGDALAKALAEHDVCLMRGHGSVACGPTLEIAVFRAVYAEVNARIKTQAVALSGGAAVKGLSAEEAVLADGPNRTAGKRAWDLWRTEVRMAAGW